ncbi:MAG: ABC transporter substrate-binding protein [Oscillochloridaceae bacterium]|nr:ABC transporter substrate-binding protein [Chloroflexaceae bacterium]MDW8389693.1 ABC transporter substrate-binding protein [Oscillochloridaceae bacterium]
MSRFRLSWMATLLLAIALVACGGPRATQTPTATPAAPATATPPPAPTAAPPTPAPTVAVLEAPVTNLTEGCVTDYDPDLDYFPEKVTLEDASGWTIEYFNNYKLITVLNPWRDADVQFRYVLVQCGTPAPPDVGDAQVIEVPVKSIITMSTTQLPHLKELDLLDRLVGVDTFKYINTPEVVELIEAGKLKEIGSGAELNVEQAIDLEPDLVMTYGVGNPEFDSHPKLLEAGLKVAMNSEYMEPTPLGRAEWIKFTAAFFNREALATEVYAGIAGRYAEMAAKAQAVTDKPTVFSGAPFRGTWYMPGGNSYAAKLLADAGAAYLWADDTSTGSMQLSFEEVLDRAKDADIWVNPGSWKTLAEGLAQDERFAQFAAFQNGRVYNNNRRLNANGGNDYWETGVTNPDLVLADLIAIFHPELLPDHEFVFYQRLE